MANYYSSRYELPSPKRGKQDILEGWSSLTGPTQFPMDDETVKSKLLDILKIIGGAGQFIGPESDLPLAGVVTLGKGAGSYWPSQLRDPVERANDLFMRYFKGPYADEFAKTPIVLTTPREQGIRTMGVTDNLEHMARVAASPNFSNMKSMLEPILEAPIFRQAPYLNYKDPVIGLTPLAVPGKYETAAHLRSGHVKALPKDLIDRFGVERVASWNRPESDVLEVLVHEGSHNLYDKYFRNSPYGSAIAERLFENPRLKNTLLNRLENYKGRPTEELFGEAFARSSEPLANWLLAKEANMPLSPRFVKDYYENINPNFTEALAKLWGSGGEFTPLDLSASFTEGVSPERLRRYLGSLYDPSWQNMLYRRSMR